MISIALAQKLKKTGLQWKPSRNDFFMIPDRGLDDSVFVVNDMAIFVEMLRGHLSITFHGTPEWALDDILVTEVVWLPTEAQLRERLETALVREPQSTLTLTNTTDGYLCEINFQDQPLLFEAFGASDAYGLALLYILENENSNQ